MSVSRWPSGFDSQRGSPIASMPPIAPALPVTATIDSQWMKPKESVAQLMGEGYLKAFAWRVLKTQESS